MCSTNIKSFFVLIIAIIALAILSASCDSSSSDDNSGTDGDITSDGDKETSGDGDTLEADDMDGDQDLEPDKEQADGDKEESSDPDLDPEPIEEEAELPAQAYNIDELQDPESANRPEDGEYLILEDVVVTQSPFELSESGTWKAFFVSEIDGGEWQSLTVIFKSDDFDIEPEEGDLLDLEGNYQEWCGGGGEFAYCNTELILNDFSANGTEDTPEAVEIDNTAKIANGGSLSQKYQGALVQISDSVVTELLERGVSFEIDGKLPVSGLIYDFDTPVMGTVFSSITGFLYTSDNSFRLLPRMEDDIQVDFIPDGDEEMEPEVDGDIDPDIEPDVDEDEDIEPDMDEDLDLPEEDYEVFDGELEIVEIEEELELEIDIEIPIVHPFNGEVIVTEIMFDPESVEDENGEWFELYNTHGLTTFNLKGCEVGNLVGDWQEITEDLLILPDSHVVLGLNSDTQSNGGVDLDYTYSGFLLENGTDGVRLRCDVEDVDEVYYNPNDFASLAGYALSLDPEAYDWLDNNLGSNWCPASASYGDGDFGTPGELNTSCESAPDGDQETEIEGPLYDQPVMGQIIITEIMANPSAADDNLGEWFEVYNTAAESFDLWGCKVSDNNSSNWHDISTSLTIAPGEYLVFGINDDTATNGDIAIDFEYSGFQFNNSGDDAVQLYCGENAIDEVFYSSSTWPISAGQAMNLNPESFDSGSNDQPENWCLSANELTNGDFGTPAEDNTICESSDGDIEAEIEAEVDESTGTPAPLQGELVISEIMPWPSAVTSDYGEWFEMVNVSNHAVDIAGCEIADDSDEHWMSIGSSLAIDPLGVVVFGINDDYSLNGGVRVDIAWSGFGLNDGGDSVRMRCNGNLIDAVTYTDTWPGEGGTAISLDPEQIDSTSNDSVSNWCAAATSYGDGDLGTPGTLNPSCSTQPDGDAETETDQDSGPNWPSSGELVITEIMNDPTGIADANGEWIELANISGTSFELQGCEIANIDDGNWTAISQSYLLAAGETLVWGRDSNTSTNGGYSPDLLFGFDLDNMSDFIRFRCGATIIDEVLYDSSFPSSEGAAMSLDYNATGDMQNDSAENWCDATASYGSDGNYGTPGSDNPTCAIADGDAELAEDEEEEEPEILSVYDLQFIGSINHPQPESSVWVGNVVVTSQSTALDAGASTYGFFVSDQSTGYYTTMMFAYESTSPVNFTIGDEITCSGTYQEYCNLGSCTYTNTRLLIDSCSLESSGNTLPSAVPISDPATVANGGYLSDSLQGALLTFSDSIVTQAADIDGEWQIDSLLTVDDLFSYSYTAEVDDNLLTLKGFLYTSGDNYKLEPRFDADIEVEQSGCQSDYNEPNDNDGEATIVGAGRYDALTVCESDTDWFEIALTSGDTLEVAIYFKHANGDLSLSLIDGDGSSVLQSASTANDDEMLATFTATATGSYYLKVEAILDATNNYKLSISVNGANGTQPAGNLPGSGDLVISEFLASPSNDADAEREWFEIYNPSPDTTYNLEGMRIRNVDASEDHPVIAGGTLNIAPGEYLLFAIEEDTTINGGMSVDYMYTGFTLGNTADSIKLYNPYSDTLIDEVAYSDTGDWSIFQGFSMNLDPDRLDSADNDSVDNWCYGSFVYDSANFGTPGAANSECGSVVDGDVEDDSEQVYEWPELGDIVVVEIMKNPLVIEDGDGEWFEIFNSNPNFTFELKGCFIKDAGTDSHEITSSLVLAPLSRALLAANGNSATNGGINPDYVYGSDITLGNGDDEVIIECDNIQIDAVYYTDSFGDIAGKSIALDPRFPNYIINDAASRWCTPTTEYDSVNHNYGTPGSANNDQCGD